MSTSDWQPIGGAPKDGTVVDLWVRSKDDPRRGHKRLTDYKWCTTHKAWRSEEARHFVDKVAEDCEVTHYRIPQPPPEFEKAVEALDRLSRLAAHKYWRHTSNVMLRHARARIAQIEAEADND